MKKKKYTHILYNIFKYIKRIIYGDNIEEVMNQQDKSNLITNTFQSLQKTDIRRLFSKFEDDPKGGFNRKYYYDDIQIAVKMCEDINQCKSIFNN